MRNVLGSVRRPDVWLPAAGILVASALIILGAAAARAAAARHAVALEGRTLRLAQQVERDLREAGPEAAGEVLRRQLADGTDFTTGLALLDFAGDLLLQVGELPAEGARDVELHLGRVWRQGSRPGRRVLRIAIATAALGQAPSERLLLPVTVFSGLVLAALSALGGRLLARQQREQQTLAMQRRLAGLARAGAGLAHQLRTPLATIKGSCQLLLERDELSREASDKRLEAVVSQTERMETMLQQLLDYARPPAAEPAAVDVEAAARDLVELDVERVRTRIAASLEVWADPEHLREILSNLVDNALRASAPPEAGERDPVEIAAEADGRFVEIRVTDRGPGPGDDPESLFEPYVTHRADGTGLGLPIARSLAEANGGRLDLVARPGGGTSAVLRLPRAGPT